MGERFTLFLILWNHNNKVFYILNVLVPLSIQAWKICQWTTTRWEQLGRCDVILNDKTFSALFCVISTLWRFLSSMSFFFFDEFYNFIPISRPVALMDSPFVISSRSCRVQLPDWRSCHWFVWLTAGCQCCTLTLKAVILTWGLCVSCWRAEWQQPVTEWHLSWLDWSHRVSNLHCYE